VTQPFHGSHEKDQIQIARVDGIQGLQVVCVPIGLGIAILVTDVAREGINVGGLSGAVVFGAIFCGLNWLYFAMTERVIFKDQLVDCDSIARDTSFPMEELPE
jgi:hypothetical protein